MEEQMGHWEIDLTKKQVFQTLYMADKLSITQRAQKSSNDIDNHVIRLRVSTKFEQMASIKIDAIGTLYVKTQREN